MIAGLYLHRQSSLHRLSAGTKLAILPIVGTALFLVPSVWLSAAMLALTTAAYPLARFSLWILWRQVRPLLLILALVFAAQIWFAGVEAAALFSLRLAALILLAALVTLTTRTSEIVAALENALSPLRPLGVDPAKIGFAISMTIRFVPLVASVVEEVREAQAARGLERNILRLAVPVIVRLLKASDEIAEAVDARS